MNTGKILIVDDDRALLEALPDALRLRMNGIAIDTAETAADALRLIEETDYDAIVTDIKMPGMDGLALLSEIHRVRPRTPTLLVTGHGEHDLTVQALRGGAFDFVQKPIDRDYFVASIQRAIRMRSLDRQVEQQRAALERDARVLEHVDDGVFLVDREGTIQYWNPAAHAITGLAADRVVGRRAADVLPGWAAVAPAVPVASAPGPGRRDAKAVPLDIDGSEVWLSISGVEFDDGVVYAFHNLSEERALDALKSEFMATVSHELRTPLAAIYGAAQTLRRPDLPLDEASTQRLLHVIADESERLTRIAEDILLANSLDSGRLQLRSQRVELGPLVREVAEEMRAYVADRDDITIEVAGGDSRALVCADRDRLRQVLLNLAENAVKYSPDGGRVELRVETGDNRVRIAVRDEGLGIPRGEEQRIFGKFYRVDPNLTRGIGGTGLGLYICRELVRRMEGRVSVTSREREGSTFVVDLPLAAVPERAAEDAIVQTA